MMNFTRSDPDTAVFRVGSRSNPTEITGSDPQKNPYPHNKIHPRLISTLPENAICNCSRSIRMPLTDHITDIAPFVRTYS